MARPEELHPGNCYFVVQFHDSDLLFPHIRTLTYVECEEDSESSRAWLFEDPSLVSGSDGEDPNDDEPSLTSLSDDQLYQVLDFPGLIRILGEIAPDHPIQPMPPRDSGPATAAQLGEVRSEVAKFLEGSDYLSLTITILFTDHGLSIARDRGDGYHMSCYPRPRREPEEESQIRALFESIGTAPRADYLANGGRTRVLEFPIPHDLETIALLCGRLLTEVFGMREINSLKYEFLSRSDIE